MRLELLCQLTMRYTTGRWHRPYARAEEGLGFGRGDGEVTGEIEGAFEWANFPRRREDGVWTPNLRGVIRTRTGDEILVAIHGQSVEENTPGHYRAILARVELTTEVEQYRWLNTCFAIGEGEIDDGVVWWLRTYVCVNEIAHGPPSIGAEPPERFRQTGATSPRAST